MYTFFHLAFATLLVTAGALVMSATTLNCTSTPTCSAGTNFGTVSFSNITSTSITVTVTLASGDQFVSTGSHSTFLFNSSAPVTISGLTAGFAVGVSPATQSGFGTFGYSINCTAPASPGGPGCGTGASSPAGNTLSFNVNGTGLSLAIFTANAGGYYFSGDIVQNCTNVSGPPCAGPTGAVGSNQDPGGATPEPSSSILLVSGLGALVVGKLRRKRTS